MEIKEVNEIPPKYGWTKVSKYKGIIKEFLEKGFEMAKIEGLERKSSVVTLSIRHFLLRTSYPIKVYNRNGEVYLQRIKVKGGD